MVPEVPGVSVVSEVPGVSEVPAVWSCFPASPIYNCG